MIKREVRPPAAFLATKVWTRGREHGIEQMRHSMQLLHADCIDLMRELLLRWIVSHPAVTCVIPATRNPEHMQENLRAGEGRLLTTEERRDVVRRLARA